MRYYNKIRRLTLNWALPSDENITVLVVGELLPASGDGWNEPREPSYFEVIDVYYSHGAGAGEYPITDVDLADIQREINELSSFELESL